MWRDRLGPVDHHPGVVAFCHLDHLADRQDRAQAVRGMGERNDFRSRTEQLLVFLKHDLAAIVYGDDPQDGSPFPGDRLPGDDVGMMLKG